jgi:hypothetical protein
MEDDGGFDFGSFNRSFTTFNLTIYVPNTRIRGDVEYDSLLTVREAAPGSELATFDQHYFTLADAPPADLAAQRVTFSLTPASSAGDIAALFSEPPSIRPDGALKFALIPFVNGTYTATFRVTRSDRAPCVAGDELVSAGRSECRALPLTIVVVPVNQPPEFTMSSYFSVVESAGPQVRVCVCFVCVCCVCVTCVFMYARTFTAQPACLYM